MNGGTRAGDIYSGALLGWSQQNKTDNVAHTNKVVLANCKVDVDITLDVTGKGVTGDIIIGSVLARTGYVNIINCENHGDISVSGDGSKLIVGGVVGYMVDTDTTNCVNYGNVTVKNTSGKDTYAGGVVGTTASSTGALKLENSINKGTVLSDGAHINYTGGVIGCSATNKVTVNNCANLADVTSKSTSSSHLPYAGGILGYTNKAEVSVLNSYNCGNIATFDDNNPKHNPGGIVGVMNNSNDTTFIKDCITSTKTYKGWMAATNPAENCVVEADASIITDAAKAIEDTINSATSATVNGVVYNFADPATVTLPAPETTEAPETTVAPEATTAPETTETPTTTEPDASGDTGDSAIIFAAVAIITLACIAFVASKREN